MAQCSWKDQMIISASVSYFVYKRADSC